MIPVYHHNRKLSCVVECCELQSSKTQEDMNQGYAHDAKSNTLSIPNSRHTKQGKFTQVAVHDCIQITLKEPKWLLSTCIYTWLALRLLRQIHPHRYCQQTVWFLQLLHKNNESPVHLMHLVFVDMWQKNLCYKQENDNTCISKFLLTLTAVIIIRYCTSRHVKQGLWVNTQQNKYRSRGGDLFEKTCNREWGTRKQWKNSSNKSVTWHENLYKLYWLIKNVCSRPDVIGRTTWILIAAYQLNKAIELFF